MMRHNPNCHLGLKTLSHVNLHDDFSNVSCKGQNWTLSRVLYYKTSVMLEEADYHYRHHKHMLHLCTNASFFIGILPRVKNEE